jgi:hypothetical protein
MSKRISLYEDQVKLTELMDKLNATLNESTKAKAMKNIDDNKVWVESAKYNDVSLYIEEEIRRAEAAENQLRLPKTVIPERYRIHLDARNIHTVARGYKGEVEIDVKIIESTDYIMLHSKSQVIDELKVMTKDGLTEIAILRYNLFAAADTLTIYFTESQLGNHHPHQVFDRIIDF